MVLADTLPSEGASDSLTMYLAEIGRAPLLSAEDEVALARAMETGREAAAKLATTRDLATRRTLESQIEAGRNARDRFLESNLRLVVSVAKRYRTGLTGIDLLDLIQEGNLGLVRAVDKFDWRRGFKFSTYGTWWIRQAVQRAMLEKGRPLRVPPRVHDAAVSLHAIRAQFQAERGRTASVAELAERSGMDVALVEEALSVGDVTSLESPIGDDGAVLGDFIELADEPSPEEIAVTSGVAQELRKAIERLDERERLILLRRFGFHDEVPRTRAEIGELIGLTAERIHQLEKAALCRLRHPAFGLRERDLT